MLCLACFYTLFIFSCFQTLFVFSFLDTFCCFSCFQTLFLLFLEPKVSKNGRKLFSYFYTLSVLEIREKVSRNRRNKNVSRNGRKSFLPFLETFRSRNKRKVPRNRRNGNKCLETGENVFSHFQTLLGLEIRENVLEGWKVDRRKGVYKQEKWQKVSRNGRKQFLPFIDTFRIQGILQFLLFLDTFGKGCKVGR